jgi:hypothetical protein
MAYKVKSKAGRKKKAVKVYSIRKMLPKKLRKKYSMKIKGEKLYLKKK